VHPGVYIHFCSVSDGAPIFVPCSGQVRDTLQVCFHTMAGMSLWAIELFKNPPKYPVAIHRTIVQKHCCDPQCLPTLTRDMLATIKKTLLAPEELRKVYLSTRVFSFLRSSLVHSTSRRCRFSLGLRIGCYLLVSFNSYLLLIVQGFAIWIIWWAPSC